MLVIGGLIIIYIYIYISMLSKYKLSTSICIAHFSSYAREVCNDQSDQIHINVVTVLMSIDRHRRFKSGNICKSRGSLDIHQLYDSLMISMEFHLHKKSINWSESILWGACP